MSCSLILIETVPFTAHRSPSHRLSQSPAVCRAAWLRVESRCSERHWTAQSGGASLECYRFLSLSPSCVKVQLRPFVTSLLPCAQTPSTGPHSGSVSCSSFRASTFCKEKRLLSHNSLVAWSVLSSLATLQEVRVQCITHSCMFLFWVSTACEHMVLRTRSRGRD